MLKDINSTNLVSKSSQNDITMSSREIAELVNSRHDKVKQSIERLAERGVISLPPLGEYLDSLGRKASEYRIGKRDSYVIVAQLSPEFTARLVDRWQELEQGGAELSVDKLLSSPTHVVALLQGYAEQVIALKDENTTIKIEKMAMQQDVDAVKRIAGSDDLFGVRLTANILDMPQNKFTDWIQKIGWAYRQNGSRKLLCYAKTRKAGFCRNVAEPYIKPDGSDGVRETLKFYPAGIVVLARKLNIKLTIADIFAFSELTEPAQ